MEKYLAIDLGTTSLGIATNDSLGIVHGRENFLFEKNNFKKAREHLLNYLEIENIKNLVVGYPLMINGEEQTRCASTKKFIEDLLIYKIDLKIFYEDERYSTIEAREKMEEAGIKKNKQDKLIDMFSAIVILERFIRRVEKDGVKW